MKTLRTLIAASFLAIGISLPAWAQTTDTGSATVEIVAPDTGTVSATISDVNFGQLTYSFEDQTATGTVTITATDDRGTAGGWNLTLQGTDFNNGGTETFAITNLNLTAGTVTTTGGNGTAPVASANTPVTTTAAAALTAAPGTGDGSYSNAKDATLTVPGGTLVGTYTSTLTVEITEAP